MSRFSIRLLGAAMNESIVVGNREPVEENSLAPAGLVELPLAMLREVAGGEIGSGLIVVPK
jgi:hypothetical protein